MTTKSVGSTVPATSADYAGRGGVRARSDFDPLVLAWADDLFLHGVHLARWIVDYVDLEESLAVGTLAQEQQAHARELLIAAGLDAAECDRRLFDRPACDWAPSRLAADPIEEWPQVVAAGLLLTHATLAMLAEADATDMDAADPPAKPPAVVAITSGSEAPDRDPADEAGARVAGIVAEQRLHLMHWQRWAVLLAGSPATRELFVSTLHWAGELAHDVLGDLPEPGDSSGPGRDWLDPARDLFTKELAGSLVEAGIPEWSFEVTRSRRPGEHALLVQPVLTDQQAVRRRYPEPVLQP